MSNFISLLSAVVHLLETVIRGGGDRRARRRAPRQRRTGYGRARPADVVTLGLVAIAAIAILAIVAAIAIAAGAIGPVPDHATHTPVAVLDRREASGNGKFGYVVDPDGTLLELWEPAPDA